MFQEAELGFTSYKPLNLEKGMMFLLRLHEGTNKEYVEVYKLNKVPLDQELYISRHGYPIELNITYNGQKIVDAEQLGWFDRGDDSDVLSDIDIEQINTILNNYQGWLMVDLEIYEGKVTIRYLFDEYDDDDDDDELPLCYTCDGSGEGMHSEAICITCHGSGVINKRNNDDDDDDDENNY